MKDLVDSKKFRVFVTSALTAILVKVAGKHGYVLDPETATELANLLVGLASAYLVGQGLADWNKSATLLKIEDEKASAETKQR